MPRLGISIDTADGSIVGYLEDAPKEVAQAVGDVTGMLKLEISGHVYLLPLSRIHRIEVFEEDEK